jgi:hypothetical protein
LSDMQLPHFSGWLGSHRGGDLDDEITASLAELVTACSSIGKPGRLTIEIDLKPAGPGSRTLVLVDNVKLKVPEGEREAAVYYVDREGRLSRNDPYQQRFESLMEVGEDGQMRPVSDD